MKKKTYRLIENISESIMNAFPYLTAKEHSEVMENFIYNSLKKNLSEGDLGDTNNEVPSGFLRKVLKGAKRNTKAAMRGIQNKIRPISGNDPTTLTVDNLPNNKKDNKNLPVKGLNPNYAASDFDPKAFNKILQSAPNYAVTDFDSDSYGKNLAKLDFDNYLRKKHNIRKNKKIKAAQYADTDDIEASVYSDFLKRKKANDKIKQDQWNDDDETFAKFSGGTSNMPKGVDPKTIAMIAALAGTTIAGGVALYKKYGPSIVNKIKKEVSPSMLEKAKGKFKSLMKKIHLSESAYKSHKKAKNAKKN